MTEERTTLQEVPSGKVEIIWNGVFLRVEANCNCLDALPICKGMCCRLRVGYSVELEPDEVERFEHREHPTRKGVQILASKADNLSCLYLDDKTSLCTVHEKRPKMCRLWHCSTNGQMDDPEIERRDAGWMLLPVRAYEAEFVRNQK